MENNWPTAAWWWLGSLANFVPQLLVGRSITVLAFRKCIISNTFLLCLLCVMFAIKSVALHTFITDLSRKLVSRSATQRNGWPYQITQNKKLASPNNIPGKNLVKAKIVNIFRL